MKIIDESGNIIEHPNLELGYLKPDKEIVHHNAIKKVEEEFHYETIAVYDNGGKDVKKVIDREAVNPKDAWDEEIAIKRYTLYTPEELNALLEQAKQGKIEESKTALATYLKDHPILWSDGKYYSVTSEKQSLLTSNLALYQISAAAGMSFKLTWNSTGDECVEWAYEDLAALALAIGTYVKPFVSHQQELELDIKDCKTRDELSAIDIDYDVVKQEASE